MDKDKLTDEERQWLSYNPNTSDIVEFIEAREKKAVEAYRAELLAGSGEPVGYKRDEGTLGSSADAMHDMAKAGACWDGYEYVYTSDQLAAAVLREREECRAVLVEMSSKFGIDSHEHHALQRAAIRLDMPEYRARGEK